MASHLKLFNHQQPPFFSDQLANIETGSMFKFWSQDQAVQEDHIAEQAGATKNSLSPSEAWLLLCLCPGPTVHRAFQQQHYPLWETSGYMARLRAHCFLLSNSLREGQWALYHALLPWR